LIEYFEDFGSGLRAIQINQGLNQKKEQEKEEMFMRSRMLILVFMLLPLQNVNAQAVAAVGELKGIWSISTPTAGSLYATIHEVSSQLFMIFLDGSNLEWSAALGLRDAKNGANACTMVSAVVNSPQACYALDIKSTTEIEMTVSSCTPASNCAYKKGDKFTVNRVY
tara:strand:+ start:553 stop:1053 length:501 start_codon:yes stop_codon:yes gene_type:complete